MSNSIFQLIEQQIKQQKEQNATTQQVEVAYSFMFGALKQIDFAPNELAELDGKPVGEVVQYAANRIGSDIAQTVSDDAKYRLMLNGIAVDLNSLFNASQTGLYRITYPAGTTGF